MLAAEFKDCFCERALNQCLAEHHNFFKLSNKEIIDTYGEKLRRIDIANAAI
jgi:hypothetical protein